MYNNYKVQLRERARTFHRQRRLGLAAAFHQLDTNKSGFVRIGSCARVLNELSRPNVSIFHWENSAYQETQKTRAILQSWWNKVAEKVEAEKIEEEEETLQQWAEQNGHGEENMGHSRTSRLVSRVTRPVDDLIPIDAFCEMMISVKADINGDGEELDYEEASPNGLCYRETVGFCRSLSTVLRHRFFDWSIGVIVVLNTLIIIVEADINAKIPSGGKATKSLLLCETLNAVLGYFYVVELLLKIMVLGGATYWMRLQHRFDALTAALVVAGQIIMRAAVSQLVPICDVIQYILLLRLTRTLRLVVLVRRFNEIFGTFVDLIPAFSTLFGMMWTVFSVFASIGMVLFGGRVRYSSIALNGTDYAESDYFANNFNDFTSSLVTLFELLVGKLLLRERKDSQTRTPRQNTRYTTHSYFACSPCSIPCSIPPDYPDFKVNNWQVLMDGFVRVTSPYHRWFFILFWSIAVVVILNLVVAFILEAFFTKDEQRRNQDEVGSPEGSAAANGSNTGSPNRGRSSSTFPVQTPLSGVWFDAPHPPKTAGALVFCGAAPVL